MLYRFSGGEEPKMRFTRYYLNRTACDALAEMRRCAETGNYSYLPGLIEEVQSMVNRMEAGLSDHNDLEELRQSYKKLTKEYNELLNKKEELDNDNIQKD